MIEAGGALSRQNRLKKATTEGQQKKAERHGPPSQGNPRDNDHRGVTAANSNRDLRTELHDAIGGDREEVRRIGRLFR